MTLFSRIGVIVLVFLVAWSIILCTGILNYINNAIDDDEDYMNHSGVSVVDDGEDFSIDTNQSFDWNDYRIGDGLKKTCNKQSYDPMCKENACKRWPNSVVCAYWKRTNQILNITVLADIVRQWNTTRRIDNTKGICMNIIVVHLRLGDALCGRYDLGSWHGTRCKGSDIGTDNALIPSCWEHESDCMVSSSGALYAYTKDYYEPVIVDLLEAVGNRTKVVVVADPTHWTRNKDMRNGNYSIDYAYRDNVISFFRSKGFDDINLHRTSTPDDDFVYMCNTCNFVQGGGGFSKLIASVVTFNGRRVFKPRNTKTMDYNNEKIG